MVCECPALMKDLLYGAPQEKLKAEIWLPIKKLVVHEKNLQGL